MELNEYQNLARRTAIYPSDYGLTYTILGLIGEAGEYHQDPNVGEKGDNFWYFAQLTYELGLPLSYLKSEAKEGDYVGKICELGNIYKKMWRDDQGTLTPKRRTLIINTLMEAFNILWYDGIDSEEAMVKNVEKLQSRMERGKLGGSGDDR